MKRYRTAGIILLFSFLVLAFMGCSEPQEESRAAMSVSQFSVEYLDPGDYVELSISTDYKYKANSSRLIFVLSQFSPFGEPIPMDGSSTTLSSYDLVNEAEDLNPIQHKAIQEHQAVYVPEGILKSVTLVMKEDALRSSIGAVLQLDVFLQERDEASQTWTTVSAESRILYNGTANFPAPLQAPAIPQLTKTSGFCWEITNEEARLIGPGTVSEPNVYLPSKVFLSPGPELPDAYICMPSAASSNYLFANLGSAYDIECLDGTILTDPLLFFSETIYISAIHVYDINTFATDYATGVIPEATLVLPSGTYFQTQSVGYTIDPKAYSKSTPLRMTFLSNAAEFRYIEDPINGTEYPVVIQGDAFFNCDRLSTVTFDANAQLLENKMRWAKGGMFSGCDNLTAVYGIPEGITDMHRTFEYCVNLSVTPQIPSTVTDMQHCFRGCSSMVQLPDIPEGVTNLYYAFFECTSLTGTATIPLSAIDPTDNMSVYCSFKHCPNLERVCIDSCPLYPYATYATNLPVEYLRDHISIGTCTYCKTINHSTEKVDGITIVADSIPTPLYAQVVNFVDDVVPDKLKDACNHMTLTTDLAKYVFDPDMDLTYVLGYATDPGCDIYILMDPEGTVPKQTIYHELAHCYDFSYSRTEYLSDSDEWRALHEAEGDMAKLWYNQESYHSYDKISQQMETFAIAASCYFIHPVWLMDYCPGMYAYMKTLFTNTD